MKYSFKNFRICSRFEFFAFIMFMSLSTSEVQSRWCPLLPGVLIIFFIIVNHNLQAQVQPVIHCPGTYS